MGRSIAGAQRIVEYVAVMGLGVALWRATGSAWWGVGGFALALAALEIGRAVDQRKRGKSLERLAFLAYIGREIRSIVPEVSGGGDALAALDALYVDWVNQCYREMRQGIAPSHADFFISDPSGTQGWMRGGWKPRASNLFNSLEARLHRLGEVQRDLRA